MTHIARAYVTQVELEDNARALRKEIKTTTDILMLAELKKMKRVLVRLRHIDSSDVLQVMGRVAAEVSARGCGCVLLCGS